MLDFFKKILLALGLSAAFLFIIYFTARAKEEERNVQHFAMPYQVMEVFVDGKEGQIFVGMSEKIKLAEIAADLGAKPHPEDKFSALPEFPDFIGRRIYLYRTPIYIVYDQDRKTDYRSFAKTVGELLAEKKIQLGVDDKINFSPDTSPVPGYVIKITRVAKTKVIEKESIDFKIIKKDDPTLDKGKTKVKQAGVEGERQLTYEVTRENGIEISKVLLSVEVISQPVDQIVYIGTKVVSYGTGVASYDDSVSGMVATCNLVPRGTVIRVVNLANGKSVEVTSIGKGLTEERVIDLSPEAFTALGASLSQGLIQNVRLEKVY